MEKENDIQEIKRLFTSLVIAIVFTLAFVGIVFLAGAYDTYQNEKYTTGVNYGLTIICVDSVEYLTYNHGNGSIAPHFKLDGSLHTCE